VQRDDVLTARRRSAWLPAVVIVAASVALAPRQVGASSCTSPDLVETIPADGTAHVPTNASLFARYETIAQYQGETVTLEQVGSDTPPGPAVPATFDATSGLLQVTPAQPLTANQSYILHWPSLRGLDTATLGSKTDLHFTTGSELYVSPPTFAGITGLAWDVSRASDPCTNAIVERYVYRLALGMAADDSQGANELVADGGVGGSLTLLVFQTSGPGVDADAPSQVLVRRMPPVGEGVQVTSTVAVGHICFSAIVRDLALKSSPAGGPPVCVDTVAPPFFYGCDVAGAGGSGGLGAALALGAVALATIARVGRGARRSRGRPACTGQGRGGQ